MEPHHTFSTLIPTLTPTHPTQLKVIPLDRDPPGKTKNSSKNPQESSLYTTASSHLHIHGTLECDPWHLPWSPATDAATS